MGVTNRENLYADKWWLTLPAYFDFNTPTGKKVKHSMVSCGQKNVYFIMLICVASAKALFSIVNGTYMYISEA